MDYEDRDYIESIYEDWRNLPHSSKLPERCAKGHQMFVRIVNNDHVEGLDPDPRPNRFCALCGSKWRFTGDSP